MAVRFNIADITRFHQDGETMKVTAIARHPGVLRYRDGNGWRGELVSPLFLRRIDSDNGMPIISKIAGIPTTNEHPPFLFKYRRDAVEQMQTGKVGNDIHVFKDGATQVTFETWDAATQNLIRSGEQKGVSLGYEVGTVPAQGTWDGLPYQYEQSDPFYADHLATVRNPRAKDAVIKRYDSDDGDWAYQVCNDSADSWDLERRQSLQKQDGLRGAFAGTDLSYPIASASDIGNAWISSFRTDSEEQVRQNILAIAKEYGWMDGLPSQAIAWAQERAIPLKAPKYTPTQKKRKPMQMNFDGGVSLEIPSDLAGPIVALRTKADGLEAEVKQLREDAKFMKKKMEEAEAKGKESDDEELKETYDSYVYEKARADALEVENKAHADEIEALQANRVDGDAIATEVASRIDAYMDAVGILAPKLKVALDELEINFDGNQSVTDVQKATLAHMRPDLKLDDTEISGAYKFAKLDLAASAPRTDSVFKIVRNGVTSSSGGNDAKQKRQERMDATAERSRMTLAQQQEYDKAQSIAAARR
jgi:Tfp pilus assembly protein PilN